MGGNPGASGAGAESEWGFILPMIVIFMLFYFFLIRPQQKMRISGASLALRKFNLSEAESENIIVDIEGRISGIIGWLSTVIGINAKATLLVTNREVSFRSSSLFGERHWVAPLSNIASTHCGLYKPIGYLVIGIAIVLIGVFAEPIGEIKFSLIFLGLVLIIIYILSKKLAVSLETAGGSIMGLNFKRSVIENIPVDINKARHAIELINRKVIEAQMNTK
jgi:hypothetical protein